MICADYHVHSDFSSDSDTPMEDMIARAISLGMNTLTFTDHMDFDYPTTNEANFLFNAQDYINQLNALKEKYRNTLTIRTGIELGLQPHIVPLINQLLNDYSFDFIIGSSHIIHGEDPYYPPYWERLLAQYETEMEAMEMGVRNYFLSIKENIDAFQGFQVYGHLDYIVRYAPTKAKYYTPECYHDILTTILKTLIDTGKGIEVNTSGYKSGLGFPNPHPYILKLYQTLGGEIITIGSDAHTKEFLGYEFPRVQDLLKECGFSYYTTFEQQKPTFHKLG